MFDRRFAGWLIIMKPGRASLLSSRAGPHELSCLRSLIQACCMPAQEQLAHAGHQAWTCLAEKVAGARHIDVARTRVYQGHVATLQVAHRPDHKVLSRDLQPKQIK